MRKSDLWSHFRDTLHEVERHHPFTKHDPNSGFGSTRTLSLKLWDWPRLQHCSECKSDSLPTQRLETLSDYISWYMFEDAWRQRECQSPVCVSPNLENDRVLTWQCLVVQLRRRISPINFFHIEQAGKTNEIPSNAHFAKTST